MKKGVGKIKRKTTSTADGEKQHKRKKRVGPLTRGHKRSSSSIKTGKGEPKPFAGGEKKGTEKRSSAGGGKKKDNRFCTKTKEKR